MDDSQYLVDNQLVRNPSWVSTRRFVTEVFKPSTVSGYYQPLTMISLMFDYAIGGRPDNLRPFHKTSLILHVLNTTLLVVFVFLLFEEPWVASMVGLLFGVHPLTVEPLPWIGERKTLLAAFFVLWCLILYIRYTRTMSLTTLLACLLTYILALLSKPTSTPLPVLLLLLDYWPLNRLRIRVIIEKVPFFVVGLVFAIITVISQERAGAVTMPGEYSLVRIPLIFCHNIIFYLSKIFWPANLSPHYPVPSPLSLSDSMVVAGVVGTSILLPLLLFSLYWTRAVLVGWLFFFVAIFPTMGVIKFTNVIASDKFTYLPLVGLVLTAAWFIDWLWRASLGFFSLKQWRTAVLVSVAGLAALLSVLTRDQLVHWRDTESLCRRMMAVAPGAAMPHFGLGLYHKSQGRLDQAIEEYSEAIRLDPNYTDAHYNLGKALVRKDRIEEGIKHYEKVLQLDSGHAGAHTNLGVALFRKERLKDAIKHYIKAVEINPENAQAYNNLAVALIMQGRTQEAIKYFELSLHINSDDAATYNNLATALMELGKVDEAIKHYKEALRIRPEYGQARKGLDAALQKQK
ncbi:MAG: tetratricopeptide repeat protein [Planctomycetota bacterium]|jgi:Flp pilus assembly protein TadD